jgi:hypothetical protein
LSSDESSGKQLFVEKQSWKIAYSQGWAEGPMVQSAQWAASRSTRRLAVTFFFTTEANPMDARANGDQSVAGALATVRIVAAQVAFIPNHDLDR